MVFNAILFLDCFDMYIKAKMGMVGNIAPGLMSNASMMVSGSAQFNRHPQKSRDVPWNVSTTRVLCQAFLNSAYVY